MIQVGAGNRGRPGIGRSKRVAQDLFEGARARGRAVLDEPSCKTILAAYGVASPPHVTIHGLEDLDRALAVVALPVVLKIISPAIVHKSDVAGVRVGLSDREAVAEAIREMSARTAAAGIDVSGYLVEQMAVPGHEVMIGAVMDARFGPVVMFGIGGVFVEILGDIALRLCPITRLDAVEMIHELRGAPALFGARGGLRGREEDLVGALLAVGGEDGLVMDLSADVSEIDVNPLILGPEGIVAVDARIVLCPQ